jgi:predicted nucleic acid-binding protein
MKKRGLIAAVRPILDRMRQNGFGIADSFYDEAIRLSGE